MRSATDRRVLRGGFTLLELIVALTLVGLTLLGARGLLEQLTDTRDRIRADTIREARRANGERLLRTLVARAGTEGDSALRFEGARLQARFASWCESPSGWLERCFVFLTLERRDNRSRIALRLNDAPSLMVWQRDGKASLAYLDVSRGWLSEWRSAVSAPAAVGLASELDTLIIRIGRGF